MKLRLPGRRRPAALALTPDVVRPTEVVQASIDLANAIDGVTGARLALGYDNEYPYRWAGRRDAAANHDDLSLLQTNDVGTDYGSDRYATDWVPVLATQLAVAGGRLEAGRHAGEVRVPSWAPGSSAKFVRWRVRLEVDRKRGTDVAAEADLRVLVGPPADPPPPEALATRHGGNEDVVIDLRIATATARAGATLDGVATVTAPAGYPEAKLYVAFHYDVVSHPLERTPGQDREGREDDLDLADRLALEPGEPVEVPFSLPVPEQIAPTTETVHMDLSWWVKLTVMPRGFNTIAPTYAWRRVLVHTAD